MAPVLTISDDREVEGGSSPFMDFFVELSEPSLTDVTFRARTVSGTASETEDLSGSIFATFTIPAGNTTTTIRPRIDSDGQAEGDEFFYVEITNVKGATLQGDPLSTRAIGIIEDDDGENRPALLVSDSRIVENNGGVSSAIFDVVLSRPFATAVSIPFQTVSDTAIAGEDFSPVGGTLDFAAGETEKQVLVSIVEDIVPEATEGFDLVLDTTGLDLARGVEGAVGRATILDDDSGGGFVPVITLNRADPQEVEGGPSPFASFEISLSAPSASDVSVGVHNLPGTASEVEDLAGSVFETVVIPAGDTSATVRPRIDSDNQPEGDESYFLELFNPKGAVLEGAKLTAKATGLILDDDGENRPALLVADQRVVEGDAGTRIVAVPVMLSRPVATEVTVPFSTAPQGTADLDDVVAQSGTLTFLPGQTVRHILLEVVGDTDIEPTETVDLVLSKPTGADFVEGGSGTRATVTILDDDAGGGTLPVLSISDNAEVEGGPSPFHGFTINLSTAAPGDVTVQVATRTGGTADADDLLGLLDRTVTIPAGETTAVVTQRIDSDNTPEDDETFFVDLTNPSGAVLAGGANRVTATGTILDDDTGETELPRLVVDDIAVSEPTAGQSTATFTIARTLPSGLNVTGDFEVFGGSAEPGADFTPQTAQFTIPGGSFFTTVEVPILADALAEGEETFAIRLSNIVNAGSGNDLGEVFGIGTISDPVPAELSITAVDADKFEGTLFTETPFSFRLDRSGNFNTAFTVDYAVTGSGPDPAEPDDFPGGVFPTGTINIGAGTSVQGFTIGVATDDVIEGDEGFTLTLSNPSNGAIITQATAEGVIRDDDSNLPPLAADDTASTNAGASVLIDVLANDSDPLGDPLSIGTISATPGGTATVEGGQIRYTPDPGFTGMDSFFYDISDGLGGQDMARVFVRVGEPAPQDGVLRASPRDDDIVISQNLTYLGNDGADTYLLSPAARPDGLSIIEERGPNTIQLVDGLVLAAVAVQSRALQIDLENGARIRVLNADLMTYDVGGNVTTGTGGTELDYDAFVTDVLGLSVPASGQVAGGPVTIGEDPAALIGGDLLLDDGFLV